MRHWHQALILLFVLTAGADGQQLCGDCNGDGRVDVLDALTGARHGVGAITLVSPAFELCDVESASGDGDVDVLDALMIAQYAVGLGLMLDCTPSPNADSAVGINLSSVVSWASELAFVDAFKTSRTWIPQVASGCCPWDTGATLDVDSDGWIQSLAPDQAAGTLLLDNSDGHYPAGRYVCLYDGDGTIEWRWDAVVALSTPGRIELDVTPTDSGIYFKLVATDPMNPLRNVRIVLPGQEATYQSEPFNPALLTRWQGCKVIRFMDWARTNNSQNQDWSGRTLRTSQTQGGDGGVAVEYMVDLCNELNADAWICVPHLATDDYVLELASLVLGRLNGDRSVYVEYSNEVWNGIFAQASYAQQQGLMLGLSMNPFEAQLRFYSQRSVEIFGLWEGVFGSADRLVRVLASQSSNPWTARAILDWNGASASADALATAPYFAGQIGQPGMEATVETWTVDEVLDAAQASIPTVLATTAQNYIEASTRGLELITYEAGQHLAGVGSVADNQTITDLFIAANRHPRMSTLYTEYLDGWRTAGGHLACLFSSMGEPSKWGSWGLLEHADQDPLMVAKYSATEAWRTANPRWW